MMQRIKDILNVALMLVLLTFIASSLYRLAVFFLQSP